MIDIKFPMEVNQDQCKIKASFVNKEPYVKIKFCGEPLSKDQRELIRRLYIEFHPLLQFGFIELFQEQPWFIEKINLIKLKKYTTLLCCSAFQRHPTIVSYLFSAGLVDPLSKVNLDLKDYLSDNLTEFDRYYLSLININVLEKRYDVFEAFSFSKHIKYSEKFIDEHFKNFCRNSIFYYIDIQKPSFNILVNHIGEFNVEHAIKRLVLNKGQKEELILLSKIVN